MPMWSLTLEKVHTQTSKVISLSLFLCLSRSLSFSASLSLFLCLSLAIHTYIQVRLFMYRRISRERTRSAEEMLFARCLSISPRAVVSSKLSSYVGWRVHTPEVSKDARLLHQPRKKTGRAKRRMKEAAFLDAFSFFRKGFSELAYLD